MTNSLLILKLGALDIFIKLYHFFKLNLLSFSEFLKEKRNLVFPVYDNYEVQVVKKSENIITSE